MSLRLGALHDALLHPGDPDLATKAAEEVAGYERTITTLQRDVHLLKWMVGTNIALTLLVLGAIVGLAVRVIPR